MENLYFAACGLAYIKGIDEPQDYITKDYFKRAFDGLCRKRGVAWARENIMREVVDAALELFNADQEV